MKENIITKERIEKGIKNMKTAEEVVKEIKKGSPEYDLAFSCYYTGAFMIIDAIWKEVKKVKDENSQANTIFGFCTIVEVEKNNMLSSRGRKTESEKVQKFLDVVDLLFDRIVDGYLEVKKNK